MHPVTHVIFDLDGLLLDTETLYSLAIESILEPHSAVYSFAVKQLVMGKSQLEACQIIIDKYSLPITAREFQDSLSEQFLKLFPSSNFMPGAERLIHHLHSHGIPMAVCTGSDKSYYDLKTGHHADIFKLFSHIVCTPDDPEVHHSKPHPEPFQVTAGRFQSAPAAPANVLVFEDAPNGVTSALAAGMQVVMVPDPRMTGPALEQATLVVSSLDLFDPQLFSLPSFPSNVEA